MAKVTGTLQDIGLNAMTGKRARIIFTPDQPSVRGSVVIATAEVVAEVGANGSFSADLQPSMATNPPTPLKVAIEWQDSAGNYTRTDIPQWRVVVRDEGGSIGSQIAIVGGGVVSVKPDRADIDEAVNRVLPVALAGSAAVVEAGRLAAENALRTADLLVGSEHRAPKTGQDDAFRVRDGSGKVAFGVEASGAVALGDAQVTTTDGFRIRDRNGRIALEVSPSGRTYIYDPAFTTGGGPVDTLHVFLAVGQSNMSGRAPLTGTSEADGRIFQYGATRQRLETATIPLDMHDTSTGLSPATTFATKYLRTQPSNVGVLLIPAAHGGTGFTSSANTLTWTPNAAADPQHDLPGRAAAQALAGMEAARAAGYLVNLTGALWHQGESNGSMTTSVYASNLDGLIAYFRSMLAAPKLPFVVGQMVPEGIAANPGRERVDLAHQQTPQRLLYTGFAPSLAGGHNAGDTTHMNVAGVEYLGTSMLAALERALSNNGSALKWSQAAGRTAYAVNPLTGLDQLIYGDTGWRDVTGQLLNGWTANLLHVRRVGNQVLIRGRALNGSMATAKGIVSLTAGFYEPSSQATFAIAGTDPIEVILNFQGELQMPRIGATFFPSTFYSINLAPVPLSAPWPTVLPGAAVGSIQA